jgi:hypothetical protein
MGPFFMSKPPLLKLAKAVLTPENSGGEKRNLYSQLPG